MGGAAAAPAGVAKANSVASANRAATMGIVSSRFHGVIDFMLKSPYIPFLLLFKIS
jgi:hypothetical protein